MILLNEIKQRLDEIASNKNVPMEAVSYGLLPQGTVKKWNYFVFNRTLIKKAGTTKGDFNEYYAVNIIHEDFIPDGYVYDVIKKMLEIKGLKLSVNDSITFNYTKKGNTDVVVEIATIVFTKARYRGDVIGKGRTGL